MNRMTTQEVLALPHDSVVYVKKRVLISADGVQSLVCEEPPYLYSNATASGPQTVEQEITVAEAIKNKKLKDGQLVQVTLKVLVVDDLDDDPNVEEPELSIKVGNKSDSIWLDGDNIIKIVEQWYTVATLSDLKAVIGKLPADTLILLKGEHAVPQHLFCINWAAEFANYNGTVTFKVCNYY